MVKMTIEEAKPFCKQLDIIDNKSFLLSQLAYSFRITGNQAACDYIENVIVIGLSDARYQLAILLGDATLEDRKKNL